MLSFFPNHSIQARKIATQHALNVRAEYQKLNKNVQQNLIGAVPMVKEVVANCKLPWIPSIHLI